MYLKKRFSQLIILVLCLFGAQSLYAQEFLHRKGKYIYDANGNEVILRGIGTGNWMLQEGYMMQTSEVAGTQHAFRTKLSATIGEEKTALFYEKWLEDHFRKVDVDSLKAWGFNSIRVAMHYKWFTPPIEDEPVPGEITWIDKGFVMIDSVLAWCTENEMYLILDLHGAPGGQGKDANISDYDPTKPSLWESQANKDKTVALWRKLAERYRDEPWIGGYDLINETNWSFPGGNNAPLRALMEDITRAIREVDPNHIIFVEGNGFANDFSGMTPPWDDNMVYSFHKYWNDNTQETINFALNLRNAHNVPLWMGESGENSNTWITAMIALLEKNKIGWALWPVKKPGINNPLRVLVNSDYTRLVNYWKGTAAHPGEQAAFEAVMQFAGNHRFENCIIQRDVIDAIFRQPHTKETRPFTNHKTTEPVFAADYLLGRSEHAYFDHDSANYHLSTGTYTNWNQGWSYRNDGVDIEVCSDTEVSNGYNVGWTADGEWLAYTLESDSAAAYTLGIRSASGASGAKVVMEANGTAITPIINLPATGGWQRWQTTYVPGVILGGGTQTVRLRFEQGGSNLSYFIFADPVHADSIPFKALYAVSSDDGYSVSLTLNKALTDGMEYLSLTDFQITCDAEPMQITGISLQDPGTHVLMLSLDTPLYYGGLIRLSYTGNALHNNMHALELFSDMAVVNKLPFRFTLPARVQAEDYSINNGMVSETSSDTGGGLNMGYANPGDYLDYYVYMPQEGYYNIHFRIATIRSSNALRLLVGEGNEFANAGQINFGSTGGWQQWQTHTLWTYLPAGRYTLRLYIQSGEFNINWFQVITSAVNVEEVSEHIPRIYPNPANAYLMIELGEQNAGMIQLSLIDAHGRAVREVSGYGGEVSLISTSGLASGLYVLMARSGHTLLFTHKVMIQSDQ